MVKVKKKIVIYNWFNFIVDVGSSLGLWLGLSAIGITDLLFEALPGLSWIILPIALENTSNINKFCFALSR